MGEGARRWRIDSVAGPIELWLREGSEGEEGDGVERRRRDDAVEALCWRLACGERSALRLASRIDSALGGIGSTAGLLFPDDELALGARARELGERLRSAARRGMLRARRLAPPLISRDEHPAEPLPDELYLTPPEAPKQQDEPELTQTWFEVRLVDEIGEPVAGVALDIEVGGGKQPVVTDGDGRARIDGVYPSSGHARIAEVAALREQLRTRWDGVRPGPWLVDEPDTSLVALRGSDPIVRNLFSETLHTIVIQPWVVRARLDGLLFDTNKSFLLPAAVDAPPGVEPPVSELRGWLADHPHSHCLVVGHTDTTGDPWYNDPLSLERADSFIAYLKGDVDHWLAWYGWDRASEKRWGGAEDRMMLEAIAKRAGKPLTSGLVEWYQAKRGLEVDGDIGTNTRRALVEDYMALQDRARPLPDLLLSHGCGETFPRTIKPDEGGVDGQLVEADDAAQRRVELFLFDAPLTVQPPAPGAISQPGSQAYPEWVRRARRTEELSVESYHVLALRLCSADYKTLPLAYVLLEEPLTELRANEDGIVDIPFKKGELSRVVRWTPEDAPDEIHQSVVYFELADDDEGARRKLHNLGYPHSLSLDDAVCRFQEEFDRPVTGNLDEIRDDVHGWHDHGPPPFVASGGGPAQEPGVSPAKGGGPAKATVVPTGPFALTVGVLLGGNPPDPAGVAVVLTPKGGATIDGNSGLQVGTLGSNGQVVFDKLSGDGEFELRVGIEQAHAGGTLRCGEVQTIHTVGRRGHIISAAWLPRVTVHFKNHVLGRGVKRKVSATVVHQDPTNVSWFGSNGIGLVSSATHHATIEGVKTSANANDALLVARQTGKSSVVQATKDGKPIVAVTERLGEHLVAMTVAKVQSVRCLLHPTPPITKRDWYDNPGKVQSVTRKETEPNFADEDSLLVLLRGTPKPLELTANVKPAGTPVVWKVERNPDDHNAADARPTLAPEGSTAKLHLDATGSFFAAAYLDSPPGETVSRRGVALVMADIGYKLHPVTVHPDRWRAHGGATKCDVDSGEYDGAMRASAAAVIVGGGRDGKLGVGPEGRRGVELGWVNNLTFSEVIARYDNGKKVEVWHTQKKGSGPKGSFWPSDYPPMPARVTPPIVDCQKGGSLVGGEHVALSTNKMEQPKDVPQPSVGRYVTVSAYDAPGWETDRDYPPFLQGGTGKLETIHFHGKLRCFLCAWTRNLSLVGAEGEPGRFTFLAFAHFEWWVKAEYDFSQQPPKPVFEPVTDCGPVTVLSPQDAAAAGCEVWGPEAVPCGTDVFDPP